jgi:PKD repeat protein
MHAEPVAKLRTVLAVMTALLLAFGMLVVGGTSARADTRPPVVGDLSPVTAAADGLPTVQINGVVWSQVVVGNTVYAAGRFTRARPAGAAAGTQETVRNNLLAFDIRTGALITSFAPNLNAQAMTVTASPDGSRIYVGGDFTQADGQSRNRVAAYDTATGQLVASFRPSVNARVSSIAATNSTVYLGGSLSAVGSTSRNRLAAVRASDGGLLPWAPQPGVGSTSGNRDGNTATSNAVLALVVTGGGSQVVAAGRFDSLNGTKSTGVGALDPVSGATRPFAVGQMITNQGVNSAIFSLSTDGSTVYGTGYDFYGPGNLEGAFAADANGGTLVAIYDCRGDTYSAFPMNGALYFASHTHNCKNIEGFPEQVPRVHRHGTAYTLAPAGIARFGTLNTWVGKPMGRQLPWFPEFGVGSFTGQNQAGWHVTGNGQYLVYGGEFPRVNNVGQQGLVRFAMPDLAPNRRGPLASDFTQAVSSPLPGVARIAWRATSDQDNEYLTYRVYRDSDTVAPIYTDVQPSTWWNRPMMGYSDQGQSGSHRYRVTVTDPFGNTVATPWTTVAVTAGSTNPGAYAAAVRADGADDHWRLDETSGTTVLSTGGTDLVAGSGVSRGATGALAGHPGRAYSFNGSSSAFAAAQTVLTPPNVFTVEAWFRTSSNSGGKILGFGDSNTGRSGSFDRHVYMDGSGRVFFGVDTRLGGRTLQSGTGFNDGRYHHVVASLGPSGMALYVDGVRRGARTDTTAGADYPGYFRIGGDRTWAGAEFFNGQIDEVALYPTELSPSQVANHYSLGTSGTSTNVAPTAAFTLSRAGNTVTVDGGGSTDSDGDVTAYAWDFGDGATGSGVTASHDYAPGTYTVTLRVTDDDGATGTSSQSVTIPAAANQPPTAAFTHTVSELTVSVDADAADPDGTVASYAWTWGDGSSGSGETASHAYSAAGTYTVTLVVTDDGGATATATAAVTVSSTGGPPPLAADTFERTVTSGFGTADTGGSWSVSAPAGAVSVSSGRGHLAVATAGGSAAVWLNAVSARDLTVDAELSMAQAATGGGTYVYLTARRAGANHYRAAVRFLSTGGVTVALTRVVSNVETSLGSVTLPGVTYSPGAVLQVRFDLAGAGTTSLRAKAWLQGQPEPTDWSITRTDSTAVLQASGAVGVTTYVSGSATGGSAVDLDNYRAGASAP